MSDELVNKLRAVDHLSLEDCFCQSSLYDKAADCIEALIAERDRLRAAGEKAICHITGYGEASTARIELRAALKGETP